MRDLVQGFLGPPDRAGPKWHWWKCPKHAETKASFGVMERSAYCFGCSWSGGATWFLRDVMGWSKADALRVVSPGHYRAVRRPIKVRFPPLPPSREWQEAVGRVGTHTLSNVAARELMRRGIGKETWEQYGIRWNDREETVAEGVKVPSGILFPARCEGQLWSLKVRTSSGRPKYYQVKGGSRSIPFGLEQSCGYGTLVIAEGEPDALTAKQAVGVNADVWALRGVNNGLAEWANWLHGYDRIIQALDGDEAGQTAASLLLEQFPEWENRCPPDGMDLGEMAQKGLDVKGFLLDGYLL